MIEGIRTNAQERWNGYDPEGDEIEAGGCQGALEDTLFMFMKSLSFTGLMSLTHDSCFPSKGVQ